MGNSNIIRLRKVKISDKKYFTKWWRDKSLLKVTSGELKRITNQEIDKYFVRILEDRRSKQYMITAGGKVIGHITLERRNSDWYETQVVIGEKNQQNKGYGTKAIKQLLRKAQKLDIKKICLEVRPNNLIAIKAYEKCGFQEAGIKNYPKNKYLPQTIRMIFHASR